MSTRTPPPQPVMLGEQADRTARRERAVERGDVRHPRRRQGSSFFFGENNSSTSPTQTGPGGVEVYVGSMGHGVQWDTVTEYHVAPVHRANMCKYTYHS